MNIFSQISFSQTQNSIHFPKNFTGKWEGTLEISDENGSKINSIEMVFVLLPLEEKKWTWWMEYPKMEPKIEKKYNLIQDDLNPLKFFIDENNGIILDQFWTGNNLIGSYHLDDRIYQTSLTLQENTLYFAIIIMELPQKNSEVKNLKIMQIQMATLKRAS